MTYAKNARPQVLLLGNGVNRAFGGGSWGQLIRDISCNDALPEDCVLHLPMPLRAILVTGDTVGAQLRNTGDILYGKLGDEGHTDMLRELLDMEFDHVLTTNFSYELEAAAQPDCGINDQRLRQMLRHTELCRHAEAKYLFFTYNQVQWKGRELPVWHVHGEGRKPDSMILGHYYYANLLEKITSYVRSEGPRWRREQERGETPAIKSWADAFLFGDVYVLGFGFDVSEFDLWWLLNRKKRERADTGGTWFFAPEELSPQGINEKEELLKVLGVEVRHCGKIRVGSTPLERSLHFRDFYREAMAEIRQLMREQKEQ